MAPIGYKLCRNVFQTIPDVSFSDFNNDKKNGVDVNVNVNAGRARRSALHITTQREREREREREFEQEFVYTTHTEGDREGKREGV